MQYVLKANADLHGVLERSLRQADSLKCDADAALIQQPNGDFVAVAHAPQHSIRLDRAVGERHLARAAGAYSQFLLVATYVQTRVGGFHHESGDAFVPGGGGGARLLV
jgi:hypothetical protein